jgi:hypothetical protein
LTNSIFSIFDKFFCASGTTKIFFKNFHILHCPEEQGRPEMKGKVIQKGNNEFAKTLTKGF